MTSSYMQPPAEIPLGDHYSQQKGGNERWIPRTREELLAALASETPPAFRTALGVTEWTVTTGADGKGVRTPARLHGNFYGDFDGDLAETIPAFQRFLKKVEDHGVDLHMCRLYLTGGRGMHIEIPMQCLVPTPSPQGYPDLHLAYREMAMQLYVDSMDLRVYTCKRMWRTPNVKRDNGLYKTPITPDEAISLAPESYAQLCSEPRPHPALMPPCFAPKLGVVFATAQAEVAEAQAKRKRSKVAAPHFRRLDGVPLPSLDALLDGNAPLKDGIGWNQACMQIALLALARGWSEAETLDKAAGLIAAHRGDSSRYGGAEKRARELRKQYRYLDGNPTYEASLHGILSLVDGPAHDLHAAQGLLSIPAFAETETETETETEDEGDVATLVEPTTEIEPAFPHPHPGLMAEAVNAALEAATKPQPELTTLAALVGMAASIPGTYRLPSGMRLNLYGFGIAETGAGKDIPLAVARSIARKAGTACTGLPGSGEGLEDALPDVGAMLTDVDEVAHLLAAVNGSKAPPYLVSLAGNLLRLFSASSREYTTRALAKVKGRGEPRTLSNPCMNIIGFSTPHTLGEKLKAGNITDGLLGRFLMARGRDNVTPQWVTTPLVMPWMVEEHAQRIRDAGREDKLVLWDGRGEKMLRELQITLSAKADAADPTGKALLARSFEKLVRIAGVLAVWDNPEAPHIHDGHVTWARKFVEASDRAMLSFVSEHMHEGEVQANAAKVRKVMKELLDRPAATLSKQDAKYQAAGRVTRSATLRRSKLSAREFDVAVEHLVALEEIGHEVDDVPGGKGTNKTIRLLHLL